jgi:phosphohistidine phosphatase
MARQLWLLRHADAEPHGAREDSQRRLTARGESQARIAGLALARMEASFEAILFSPKVRARQTAELAAECLPVAERSRMAVHHPLASGFDGAQALDALGGVSAEGRLLAVGHEPDLSNVLAELTGGRADIKKGGLAIVRLEGTRSELTVLMRPRELALIAGDDALRGGDAVGVLGTPLGGK